MKKVDQLDALLHELEVHKLELEAQNEELRNANLQAESAKNRYYGVYESAPWGFFTIDRNGRIIEVNQAGADILGLDKHMVLSNYFSNFIPNEHLKVYTRFIAKVIETGQKQKCEAEVVNFCKELLHVQLDGVPVKDAIDGECIWLYVYDITDRIIAEKAREAARKIHEEENTKLLNKVLLSDKLRVEYFSSLSHELRTPLNVILSSLKLLELKRKDTQASIQGIDKHISVIKQNSYRLLRLVNNIVDSTKIEAGFFEVHPHNHNIVSIVENITLSVAEYIEYKGIELLFDTDVEEKTVACDVDLMERIMLNLLSNAVKFTKQGGSIKVDIKDLDDFIEIAVSDTGIGIPGDKLEFIFKRFCQVDTSLAKNYEGSGIGLALVKSLIEMHGGTLSVESEYGKGSKFIVRIPVRVNDEEVCEEADEPTDSLYQRRIEKLSIEFSDIYR